jgi:5-carboxymethyl-2-hydroxymuconate isomerase
MPHLTLEYSVNVGSSVDMTALCAALARCLATQTSEAQPVFPLGGIRVRALPATAFCIADGRSDAAFIHANLKIGAGRAETVKRIVGDALFDIMKIHCAQLYQQSGLALSLEMNEFSETGSWKHNNLHARLRGAPPAI